MTGRSVTMLGTGLIGDFYTATLHAQRGRDRVKVAYSRTAERGKAFADEDLDEARDLFQEASGCTMKDYGFGLSRMYSRHVIQAFW